MQEWFNNLSWQDKIRFLLSKIDTSKHHMVAVTNHFTDDVGSSRDVTDLLHFHCSNGDNTLTCILNYPSGETKLTVDSELSMFVPKGTTAKPVITTLDVINFLMGLGYKYEHTNIVKRNYAIENTKLVAASGVEHLFVKQ